MNELILLSIALTAFIGVLSTLVYTQLFRVIKLVQKSGDMALRIEQATAELALEQQQLSKRIDQLATDVLQREIYQSSDDRHQLAIECARQGQGVYELIQRHGLSSDEAALIVSLHAPSEQSDDKRVRNANLDVLGHFDAV